MQATQAATGWPADPGAASRRSGSALVGFSAASMMGSQLMANRRQRGFPQVPQQGAVQPGSGDGSRIPWLTKQADANALNLAPEGASPLHGEKIQTQEAMTNAAAGRRRQIIEALRSRHARAMAQRAEERAGTTHTTTPVEVKSLQNLVDEERSWLRPLLLSVSSFRQALAFRLQALLWRMLACCTDPEVWLEPMFLASAEVAAFYGAGALGAEGESTDWIIHEDGLFRSSSNVNSSQPWNRERLHLQLERSLWAKDTPGGDELRHDEARDVLSSGLATPRLHPLEDVFWLNKLGLRFRSQVKSKRRHLVVSQLYELRLDICRVSLFRAPTSKDLVRLSALDALDSRESRAAGELQELYHRYQREMDGDILVQLDLRLDTLVEHGKMLRSNLLEEESKAQGGAALPAAREAYRTHLQERQKLRTRRDEKEMYFDQICKSLYAKWREVRQIRQDYGFTSTPWRLTAQAQEHDVGSDLERKERNLDAEVEEMTYLQGLPVERLRDQLQSKWDSTKRPAGAVSYRFDLAATAPLTSTEALRARAFDGIVPEAEAIMASEELQRRKLVARARVKVECRVQNRVVGCSPSIPICWETAGTASAMALVEEVGMMGRPDALRPVHSFNLAVHVMPQNLSLVVYVSAGGRLWNRWHATQEVEVDLPSLGKVTHAAVMDQRLLFGPDDDDTLSSFKGELAVCVSWPGEGRDSVVPPMAPMQMDAERGPASASCWPWARRQEDEKKKVDEEEPLKPLADIGKAQALIEETYLRRRRKGSTEESRRSLRIEKLLMRMEREGMDSERQVVPGFEDEARHEELKKLEVKVEAAKKETVHQMEFRKRIQERTRRMSTVKTHMSYKSIVREHGQEAEEGNFFEMLERFQKIFQPKHTLRPSGLRRKFENSVRSIRVHVSVAKVYEAPLRIDSSAASAASTNLPPAPPLPGFGPRGGFAPLSATSAVFGTLGDGVQVHQLPEIVIELTLQDFQGNLLFRRTDRTIKSTDPDINQILELPLHAAGVPGQEELTQDNLTKYSGELTINIFDELTQNLRGSGKEVRIRRQLRHLGRFVLPWSTLYSAKCSLKGQFLVDEHPVLFGYRPKVRTKAMVASAPGVPTPPPVKETPRPMALALDVTVDPPLEHPTRVQPQITLGKEANMMLKHIQKWHDSLKSKHDTRILALGMDVDGRSRLICRYVRPQKPPEHIAPEDPFAIEMAARYVALVPSLQDNEMWNVDDLWCTDQEFLDIQCGDWEEHCILLCNYFNYIDRLRRERVAGYSSTDIQSYCVICDLVPEGEAVVVLRQDKTSGNCEFWHALEGKCFFLPASMQLGGSWHLCSGRQPDQSEELATPKVLTEVSSTIPIRKVHIVFNAENVWANLQRESSRDAHKGVAALSWDLSDQRRWKPLFRKAGELRRLSGHALPEGEEAFDWSRSWQLEDPSEALKYQAADVAQASKLEGMLQNQLEQDVINHRAGLKGDGLENHSTRFNHVIGEKLGQLLEKLEAYSKCSRRHGGLQSVFPLRSAAAPPVTWEALEEQMNDIENDFRMVGRPGRTIFGLPFNEPYKDYSLIWDNVKQSRVVELGGDRADFALKVKVFPYASGVLSIWVFIAMAMDQD